MNLKTAKKLRKLARANASAPLVYTAEKNSKRFVVEPATVEGTQQKIIQLQGTIRVNDDSFRGVYKMLKRAYRNVRK